ncbi:MAG: YceI family protein [Deltaproteobacteria bacterium]|nr:YceI family protein [Deltaproteobacteria bacterium]
MHDFEGTAPCAVLTIESPDASGRYGARAEVAVTAMKTGISARDKRMREMFDAKRFPTIVAAFSNVDPAALRVQKALPFRITIHGRERQATAVIERFSETDGREAHIVASFDLSLKDFALEAPVAMGFIRVGDLVKVTVSVDLKALPAGSAAPSAR